MHHYLLTTDFKFEFVDDVMRLHDEREQQPWHKYRRAAGLSMSLVATVFLVSVL